MFVTRFLTSTALLERRVSSDSYAGDQFAPPILVRVRWFTEDRVLLTSDRREITSNARISLTDEITVGDRVTGGDGRARQVAQVRENRDVHGNFSHYVAYLL